MKSSSSKAHGTTQTRRARAEPERPTVYLDSVIRDRGQDPQVVNAKEKKRLRSELSRRARQRGEPVPHVLVGEPSPPPELCDLLGPTGRCLCSQWPQWLETHQGKWRALKSLVLEDGALALPERAAFFRFGKVKQGGWYMGLVTAGFSVRYAKFTVPVAEVQ